MFAAVEPRVIISGSFLNIGHLFRFCGRARDGLPFLLLFKHDWKPRPVTCACLILLSKLGLNPSDEPG